MNRLNILCLVALLSLSVLSLTNTKRIEAQFDSKAPIKTSKDHTYKNAFNFIFTNGKISGIPTSYLTENAIKLVSKLEKALKKTEISKQKFRFSNEKITMKSSANKKQIMSISEEFNMEGLKQSNKKSSITEKIAMENKQKKMSKKTVSAKIDALVSALETEFTIQQREKSFFEVVNFKSYYDDGYGREKVYYEKGLSTKWIILIIIIIIIIVIVVCCCLFYMGVFTSCSDCLNSGESEPAYPPQYEPQQNIYYQQGPPQYYQYEPQYYEEKKYYN